MKITFMGIKQRRLYVSLEKHLRTRMIMFSIRNIPTSKIAHPLKTYRAYTEEEK